LQLSRKGLWGYFYLGFAAQVGFDLHRLVVSGLPVCLASLIHGACGMTLSMISPLSPNQQQRLLHRLVGSAIQTWLEGKAMARVDNDTLSLLVHVYRFRFMAPVSSPYATFRAEDWAYASPQPISQCARMVGHKIHKLLTANVSPTTTRIGNQSQWCSFIQGDLFQDSIHN